VIEQLFGSKTRVKLLHLFTSNPNRAFYVREITRKIDEQINSVRRELSNLLTVGVITSESANNRLYYEVNQDYEHYEALKSIFSEKKGGYKPSAVAASKTDDDITKKVKSLGSVEIAFLTGEFTRDLRAPIDLLIVGDVNKTKLTNFVKELEESEGREVRYVKMPMHEYKYRIDINDRFLADALESKKTIIVDKTGEIKE